MSNEMLSEIVCPYCNKSIPLDSALMHTLEEKMRGQIEGDIVQKVAKSFESQLKDLQNQVQEKDNLLRTTQEAELSLRAAQRQLEEDKRTLQLQVQRTIDEEKAKIITEATKNADETHRLKDLEKDKQMEDMKKQITELQRKAEQGSMKNQGEALELELERILRETFLNDRIEPIESGVHGADILHTVCSKSGKICGTILLESKNAKNWNNAWIQKLKEDQRDKKADIAVLVTTTLPDGINIFDFRDGIIITHYTMIIPVIMLLRIQLSEVARTRSNNVNINEKKDILYNYLTSVEFRQRVESIVEAYANMMVDLEKEKRSMMKSWAKREKQIQQAAHGLADMFGGLQGIIGPSLPDLKVLSLPEVTEEKTEAG